MELSFTEVSSIQRSNGEVYPLQGNVDVCRSSTDRLGGGKYFAAALLLWDSWGANTHRIGCGYNTVKVMLTL